MNPIEEENASVRQEDELCYSQSLTPLHAFVFGVEKFKQSNNA
jgi:hypothetical protein